MPVGILALLGMLAFMPETERSSRRGFDFFGFALLSIAVGGLQLMLDRGDAADWFSSREIVIEGVIAGARRVSLPRADVHGREAVHRAGAIQGP